MALSAAQRQVAGKIDTGEPEPSGPVWEVFLSQLNVRAFDKAKAADPKKAADLSVTFGPVEVAADLQSAAIHIWRQIVALGPESAAASAPGAAATYALFRRLQDGHSKVHTTRAEKKAKNALQLLAESVRELDTQIYPLRQISFETLDTAEKFISQSLAKVRIEDETGDIHKSLVTLTERLEREAVRYSGDHEEIDNRIPGGTQAAVLVRARRDAILYLGASTGGIKNQWAFLKSLVNLMDIPTQGSGELVSSSKQLYDEHRTAVKWMANHTQSGQ